MFLLRLRVSRGRQTECAVHVWNEAAAPRLNVNAGHPRSNGHHPTYSMRPPDRPTLRSGCVPSSSHVLNAPAGSPEVSKVFADLTATFRSRDQFFGHERHVEGAFDWYLLQVVNRC